MIAWEGSVALHTQAEEDYVDADNDCLARCAQLASVQCSLSHIARNGKRVEFRLNGAHSVSRRCGIGGADGCPPTREKGRTYNPGVKNCDTPPSIMVTPTARLTIRLQ